MQEQQLPLLLANAKIQRQAMKRKEVKVRWQGQQRYLKMRAPQRMCEVVLCPQTPQ